MSKRGDDEEAARYGTVERNYNYNDRYQDYGIYASNSSHNRDPRMMHKLQRNKEKSQSPNSSDGTNCLQICRILCDMENAFEAIEILILLQFIAFIGVWWADRADTTVLLALAVCSTVFGLIVLNIRRAQSSLRWHELRAACNDFRVVLFVLGLSVVIAADIIRWEFHEKLETRYVDVDPLRLLILARFTLELRQILCLY